MKANEFRQLIREAVKEEVSKQVNAAMVKIVAQLLREYKKPASSGHSKVVVESNEQEEQVEEVKRPAIHTGNSKLDAVLAETSKNFKPLKKTDDGSSLAELMGSFDKIGENEDAGIITEQKKPETRLDFLKQIVDHTDPMPSVLDKGAEIPDALKKVFKKDFRAIMRRIDEQKKTGGPGMINASSVLSG